MVEQIFSKKIVFEKKPAERVAGVLARIFHPPDPGGDPPAYPQDGSAKLGIFRKKNFEKKFNLAKKMAKKIFFQKRFPYCILIVWDLH